jgi:hypothetical protein
MRGGQSLFGWVLLLGGLGVWGQAGRTPASLACDPIGSPSRTPAARSVAGAHVAAARRIVRETAHDGLHAKGEAAGSPDGAGAVDILAALPASVAASPPVAPVPLGPGGLAATPPEATVAPLAPSPPVMLPPGSPLTVGGLPPDKSAQPHPMATAQATAVVSVDARHP